MPGDAADLRGVLQQSERSGTHRRAALLHIDRLPPGLARPHHLRLAREALSSLAAADRARRFDLSRGRLAVVWRGAGEQALEQARQCLEHLLAGQEPGGAPAAGELLTVYDLPDQAAWLLDEISETEAPPASPAACLPLDAAALACLEAQLGQADLSRFVRWRPVMRLGGTPGLAWEERFFAIGEIARTLCPDRDLKADPWLFARLTRTLDRRMLALLLSPRELRGCGAFSINLNIETILSAAFVAFDEALPLALRGEVILKLGVADILADPDSFTFARRFCQARRYRLALAGADTALLRFLDLRFAGFDYVDLACSAELTASPGAITALVPAASRIVLRAMDRHAHLSWAVAQGFELGSGRALSL